MSTVLAASPTGRRTRLNLILGSETIPPTVQNYERFCSKKTERDFLFLVRIQNSLDHTVTTAVQHGPNFALTFSSNCKAAASPLTTAKVVEPLPDISVAAAPFARRNS